MTTTELITYTLAVTVASATPGPAVVALLARTLTQGLWSGVIMAIGLVTGDVFYFILAVTGLTGLIALLGEAVVVLKFAGAAYLVYLGWTFVTARPVSGVLPSNDGRRESRSNEGGFRIYLSGLLITLGNPKTMLFFLAILPNLLELEHLSGADLLVLGMVLIVISLGALLCYGAFASAARRAFRSSASIRYVNRAAGSVLIGCGVVLAARE